MRLDAPIKSKGLFWLAEDEEHKFTGDLHIAENGRATLELTGSSENPRDLTSFGREDIARIIGRLTSGEAVTLEECDYVHLGFGSIPQLILRADRVFVGVGYPSGFDITFHKLKFSIEGLDEWLSISGIQTCLSPDATSSITYTPPERIEVPLEDGVTLSIAWDWTFPGAPTITEAKITQRAYMYLECTAPRNIEDLLALVFKLNNFLCFAVNTTVTLRSVTAWSKDLVTGGPDDTTVEKPVTIYGQTLPYANEPPTIELHDMLFGYGFVAPRFNEVMRKWLASHEDSGPAINLYMASQAGKHAYLEWVFLSVAQSLEVIHRRNSSDTSLPPEEFDTLVETVVSASPKPRRDWLRNKLHYANELPLRKRLTQLVEPFKELFGDNGQRSAFIGLVTDTRNYYTHYDEGLADKAAKGRTLWELCKKMEALCQLHILLMCGFEVDALNSMAQKNFLLRRKLGLTMA